MVLQNSGVNRTVKKIRWLMGKNEFKQFPVKTTFQVLKWQFLRMVNQPITTELAPDLHIKLYPTDDIATHTYYFGSQEPKFFNFLRQYLTEGMTFVDIGANIGTYALWAAKYVGKTGQVFSFEPQPSVFAKVLENIQLNEFTHIIAENIALGETDGEVEIVVDSNYSSTSYTKAITGNTQTANKCRMMSLDSYLSDHQIQQIDYLKIDVEGFEGNVLQGAVNTLTRLIPTLIQIELLESLQQRSGSDVATVRQFLEGLGYRLFFLDEQHLKLIPITTAALPEPNILCIHETKISQMQPYF